MTTLEKIKSAANMMRNEKAISGGTFEDGSTFQRNNNNKQLAFILENETYTHFNIQTEEILF
jgi:hypothetical protein